MIHDDVYLSENAKLLGIYLDNKLSWSKHIDHVCSQLNKAYFAILQLKNTLDETGLLSIYYALAYSHISLNIIAWGNSKDRSRVFINQKRLIRLIFKMRYNESCADIFKNKNILTVPCIYILKCLTYTKKNIRLFTQRNECHTYRTRHGDLLSIPLHHTTNYKHSPQYNCIMLFNSLPTEIRNSQNYNKYKTMVKNLLLKGGYYSIQDFLSREPDAA